MIIIRSPLRLPLGGGGTDLRSYYSRHGGFLVTAAIDKYVYVTLHETFAKELIIKYSQMERVTSFAEVRHPIIREALRLLDFSDINLEITSMADIPAGTGLGSSGSFTTALLKGLHTYKQHIIHPRELAQQACEIEIDILGEPIGKQDQFIAAYGGLTCFTFNADETVDSSPLGIHAEVLHNLEDNLCLFFTGYSRSASEILKDQDDKSKVSDSAMMENLHTIKELGFRVRAALESGNVNEFGCIMDEHWQIKRKRSRSMSNDSIDNWYELGIKNGAIGGKLIGAGGGGFLLFLCQDKEKLRSTMKVVGLKEVRFRFDFEGTKRIV
ncbi:galactokinase [bacterium]|nr:galactokinase [bacterium]MBP9809085.1 galactokinase [bacterium]